MSLNYEGATPFFKSENLESILPSLGIICIASIETCIVFFMIFLNCLYEIHRIHIVIRVYRIKDSTKNYTKEQHLFVKFSF